MLSGFSSTNITFHISSNDEAHRRPPFLSTVHYLPPPYELQAQNRGHSMSAAAPATVVP